MVKGINLGSGKNWKCPGWIGLDEIEGNYLSKDSILPFKNNSVENVFSSHFFEHINDDCSKNLFNEVFRILIPGGNFRIIVPDFELIHKHVLNTGIEIFNKVGFKGRPEWRQNGVDLSKENFLFHYLSNFDYGKEGTREFYRGPPKISKETARQIINLSTKDLCKYLHSRIPKNNLVKTQHINFWNVAKFEKMYQKFSTFKKSKHMESKILDIELGYFDNWKDRSLISLHVEGTK